MQILKTSEQALADAPEGLRELLDAVLREIPNLQIRLENSMGQECAVLLTVRLAEGKGCSLFAPGQNDPEPALTGISMATRAMMAMGAKGFPEAMAEGLQAVRAMSDES